MARTQIVTVIERVRRQLASGQRYEVNLLAEDLDPFSDLLSLSQPVTEGLMTGAVLNIGVETLRVLSVDTAANRVRVLRGWQDSDPAAHLANSEVWINPRFGALDIYEALLDEIGSYGPQLYRVDGRTFEVPTDTGIVELPAAWAGLYGLVAVRRDSDGESWPRANARLVKGEPGRFDGAPTSGAFVRFVSAVSGGKVYIGAALPFVVDGLTPQSDLVGDAGLWREMLDLVAMGTKIRLLADSEHNRTARAAQDEPRRADETPVGAGVQPQQLNISLYNIRRTQEANRLAALYPMRFA